MSKYAIAKAPDGENEAFDVLDEVFGGQEFSGEEAISSLSSVLECSEGDAKNKLQGLINSGSVTQIEG